MTEENKPKEYPCHAPHRIQTALDFILVRKQCAVFGESWKQQEPTEKEKKVEEAALSCLHSYFLGEVDFGDCPPIKDVEAEEHRNKLQEVLKKQREEIEKLVNG